MKMKKPFFSSPLVIRPDAKQRTSLILVLIPYLLLQGWICFRADVLTAVFAGVMIALALWHTVVFRRRAAKDVTAFLPSTLAICAVRIVYKLLLFITQGTAWNALPALLAECLFWAAFGYCAVRAVCGKYKLLVPLLFLFFGFFYTFIKYDLRNFAEIAAQICLFLLLWFPIDAVVFTSLCDPNHENP